MTASDTAKFYVTFPVQKSQALRGRIEGAKKEVVTVKGRPSLADYHAHLEGGPLVGGIPGTALGEEGYVSWVSLDLDEVEGEKVGLLKECLEEFWQEGIPVYPSKGLTRGYRLWIFFGFPRLQAWAVRFLKRLAQRLREKGLGRVEIFPSSEKGSKGTFLPYWGGKNPLLERDLLTPIPLSKLRDLKFFNPSTLAKGRRLREATQKIAEAPRGERHLTLLEEGLKAYGTGLPKEVVRPLLLKASEASGLLTEDREEVERLLSWLEEHATRPKEPPLKPRPEDLRLDPKAPLFRGKGGRSRFLILQALLFLAIEEGNFRKDKEKGLVATVMASYRRLSLASGVSLKTTTKVLGGLKGGVLEGAWDKTPEKGTIWEIPLEKLPLLGQDEGGIPGLTLETLPLLSPLGLSLGTGSVFLAVVERGYASIGELAETLGRTKGSIYYALKRIAKRFSLPRPKEWLREGLGQDLLERALEEVKGLLAERERIFSEERGRYYEAAPYTKAA